MSGRAISYVLPLLRRSGDPGLEELTRYLAWLSRLVEVIVVDGSDSELFSHHHHLWRTFALHIRPSPRPMLNGKVAGVLAGVESASHEIVVIADDDVRYSQTALDSVTAALDGFDLVRPQNYFRPLPWHAAWDTSRSLLNRSLGSDSPGTLAIRRSYFLGMGGYAGDALYENLELIRTVVAAGGRVADRSDIYVRRLPPTTRRFWEQRPRQAYDDWAQPVRLAFFLLSLPVSRAIARTRRGRAVLSAAVLSSIALAERGRRLHGGTRVFPASTSWWAPIWILERSVCVWLSLAYRLTGGIPYGGSRYRIAARSLGELRRIRAAANPVTPIAHGSRSGAPTTAEGHDRAADGDSPVLGVFQHEVAPDEKRTVRIGPDGHRLT